MKEYPFGETVTGGLIGAWVDRSSGFATVSLGCCNQDVTSPEWIYSGTASLHLELPGFSQEDIAVTIKGKLLRVDIMNWHGRTKYAGKTYKLNLLDSTDLDRVTATMKNGLLVVHFPDKQEYTRKVKVE